MTGKKPYSLAKFLSTSMVFRKTVGDAQRVEDDIAFVQNFGWAPQRFNSRARPYARESRRWKVIFNAVEKEAAGDNRERRLLAWNGNSEEQKLNQHGSESDGSE